MTVLLDTGILYAYYDRRDNWHDAAQHLIASEVRGLIIPAPVLPEVDYLLNMRLGIEAQAIFYRGLTSKDFLIADLPLKLYARVAELNSRYRDLELGFVDAAVLAMAEHLKLGRIATTDRRHFGAVKLALPLELLPHKRP
jgi:predicted nucleic acid-binding protein